MMFSLTLNNGTNLPEVPPSSVHENDAIMIPDALSVMWTGFSAYTSWHAGE
jgi:hypothetical protein